MPGKINPVMAECLDMIAFQVVGNDLALSLAVQAGQLELNVMMPLMMHNILQSIQILSNYLPVFSEKCIDGIGINVERCTAYVEKNPSLAVFLMPHVGYLEAAKIAKMALEQNRSIKEITIERGILSRAKADEIFGKETLLGKERKNI